MPKKEGLNVIPLIDIMLVLLAIVLSVSTFIAQGNIKIDLPNSESAEKKQDENDKIAVLINKDNELSDKAEQKILSNLECLLESVLEEPFMEDYKDIINRAKRYIIDN